MRGVTDVVDVLLEGAFVLIHENVIRNGLILANERTIIIDEINFIFNAIDDG
jgi:hypothetical protein